MCTAVSFNTHNHYFGRNLDLEYHFNEQVVITPRKFPFVFRHKNTISEHYAIIGIAVVEEGFPLYYDATNECGLSMAALNFPGYTAYFPVDATKDNIAPFELIPWFLCQCRTIVDCRELLNKINIVDIPFNKNFPNTPLHWLISDRKESIVIEQTKAGLSIYDNPIGVLTNSPPFPYHLCNLQNFLNITAKEPENRFSKHLNLTPYSRGMGGIGLPGDLSSASRFVRAAFTKANSLCDPNECSSVSQFFHILGSVKQQRGCVQVGDHYEITYYSSCCNTDTGVYYYTTYENAQITAISMHNEALNSKQVIAYPLITEQLIRIEN